MKIEINLRRGKNEQGRKKNIYGSLKIDGQLEISATLSYILQRLPKIIKENEANIP